MLGDSRDLTPIAAPHESVQRAAIASLRSLAMRSRLPLILAACVVAVLLGVRAGPASATTVTVLRHDGRTHIVDNPYLTGAAADPTLPSPASPGAAVSAPQAGVARAGHAASTKNKATPPKTVTFAKALAKLHGKRALSSAAYATDLRAWTQALAEEKHLTKWRTAQLTGVTDTLTEMATDGQVTVGRLPVLMLTLVNNTRYWKTGASLDNGAAVQFQGSELVWEYYAGSGIQLQVLHTFGEGDGYYEAGPGEYGKLAKLMSEMVPLAIKRAGGLAWEYYFNWEGGRPPWVSAMAQGTGLEALANAYLATGNRRYLTDAHNALPLFRSAPPTGVAVRTPLGNRYLQYSFTPGTDIINAFLQSVLGLYDYAQVSGDPVATSLYNAGNAQARSELHSFAIGGWSLYQPGQPDDLSYHTLVTGFLRLLCQKTQISAYCTTYQQFESDLLTQPQLILETTTAPAGKHFDLRFKTTKYASVGITLSGSGKNYIYTKRSFLAGNVSLQSPKLKAGTYSLAMSITDPVGHYAKLTTSFYVCKGGCPASDATRPSTPTPPTVTVPIPKPTRTTTQTTTTPTKTKTTTTPTTTTTTTTTTGTTTTPTCTGTTTTGGTGLGGC
jgi:hypothetical protein